MRTQGHKYTEREEEGVKKKHLTPSFLYSIISKVIIMEKKVMQTFLYDFYGELLNQHQQTIYEDFVLNDLSLSEIAEEAGISRQGVHDLVKRCDRMLEGYEAKLHLLERFLNTKEKITKIRTMAGNYQEGQEAETMAGIAAISNEILEEL